MNRVPSINGFLRVRECGSAEDPKLAHYLLNEGAEFFRLHRTTGQADSGGFSSADLSPREDEFTSALLSDQRRKYNRRDRRIAAQLDFWETPGSVVRGINHIANRSQLSPSA